MYETPCKGDGIISALGHTINFLGFGDTTFSMAEVGIYSHGRVVIDRDGGETCVKISKSELSRVYAYCFDGGNAKYRVNDQLVFSIPLTSVERNSMARLFSGKITISRVRAIIARFKKIANRHQEKFDRVVDEVVQYGVRRNLLTKNDVPYVKEMLRVCLKYIVTMMKEVKESDTGS